MDKVVVQLQENIEKEIQSHFGNFEEIVIQVSETCVINFQWIIRTTAVQEYWNSYCKSALSHLKNFEDAFNDQLTNQIQQLMEVSAVANIIVVYMYIIGIVKKK